jgi:rhodanese-related sulfurtransferase
MSNEITLAQLQLEMASSAPPVLVEILPEEHFTSGHLPRALNLPLPEVPTRARELLPDRSVPIVVYCAGPTCNNSHVAERALRGAGYGNVRVYRGGKSEWADAGNAMEGAS